MPFRFRRIIPLGKGFRLNLSKSGISSSVGGKGFTLNIGKRGVRPTISAPGTGLSFTPSLSSASAQRPAPASTGGLTKNCLVGTISLLLICIIVACCLGVIFTNTGGLLSSTPTDSISIETIIAETYSAARAQTLSVSTQVLPPATYTPFTLPPQTLYPATEDYLPPTIAPTWTPIPTFTQLVINTQPIGNVCSCSGDLYDCKDFSSHSRAQACYDYCVSQSRGDIHKLDQDNDGLACEGLP